LHRIDRFLIASFAFQNLGQQAESQRIARISRSDRAKALMAFS